MLPPVRKTHSMMVKNGKTWFSALLAGGLLMTGLAYAAEPAPGGATALPRLLALLNGRFDNLQQMAFVAATKADAKVNHVEPMRMQGRSFSSTQLEGSWIYSQTDKIEPGDASKRRQCPGADDELVVGDLIHGTGCGAHRERAASHVDVGRKRVEPQAHPCCFEVGVGAVREALPRLHIAREEVRDAAD